MEALTAALSAFSEFWYTFVVIILLVVAGLWFTIRTRAVQIRHFGTMVRTIFSSRGAAEGISGFQAFTVGLASRVGTGNVAGVAIALALGGPGAVF